MLRRINRSIATRAAFARAQGSAAFQSPPTGKGLWAAYQRSIVSRPLATALATSSVLWAAGDTAAQYIENALADDDDESHATSPTTTPSSAHPAPPSTGAFDYRRLAATTVVGSMMTGAGGLYWYGFLDRLVKLRFGLAPRTVPFVAAKLGMELAVFHPVTLVFFWTGVGLGTGQSPSRIASELREKFVPTLGGEVALWLPIDAANFFFVPVHLQVVVVNVGALVEAVFLSYVHARGFPGSGSAEAKKKNAQAKKSAMTSGGVGNSIGSAKQVCDGVPVAAVHA